MNIGTCAPATAGLPTVWRDDATGYDWQTTALLFGVMSAAGATYSA